MRHTVAWSAGCVLAAAVAVDGTNTLLMLPCTAHYPPTHSLLSASPRRPRPAAVAVQNGKGGGSGGGNGNGNDDGGSSMGLGQIPLVGAVAGGFTGPGGAGPTSGGDGGEGSSGSSMGLGQIPLVGAVAGGFMGPGGAGPTSGGDGGEGSSGSSMGLVTGMHIGMGTGMGVSLEAAEVGPLGQQRPMGQPVGEQQRQQQQPWVAPGSDQGKRVVLEQSPQCVVHCTGRTDTRTNAKVMWVAAATAFATEVGAVAEEEAIECHDPG